MRSPKNFFEPLAAGAPKPLLEIPGRPARMIHFVPPHNEKIRGRIAETIREVDVLLCNLEDSIPEGDKKVARVGTIEIAKQDFGLTQFWVRVNGVETPWFFDDVCSLVPEVGDKLDVIMLPKVESADNILFLDQLLANLEAKHHLHHPILIHAILETALGVTNVEEIAICSPRMQGISFGPADLAASLGMKTTRIGGGHPDYQVIADPDPEHPEEERKAAQQDPWHAFISRMVAACRAAEIFPFYGPFGDTKDPAACTAQFRGAYLQGCVGAWSIHPSQIPIAREVFSPSLEQVTEARQILAVLEEGGGVGMIEGRFQDAATGKQAQVILETARLIAQREPEYAAKMGF